METSQRQEIPVELFRNNFSPNFLSATGFLLAELTVKKLVFRLVAFNCTIIFLVFLSPVIHRYSLGCTCAASLDNDMNHCKHYYMVVNLRQNIRPEVFEENCETEYFPPIYLLMVMLTVSK